MKKYIFFAIINGLFWGLLISNLDYTLSDWQWWLMVLSGVYGSSIIYVNCGDDDYERKRK